MGHITIDDFKTCCVMQQVFLVPKLCKMAKKYIDKLKKQKKILLILDVK